MTSRWKRQRFDSQQKKNITLTAEQNAGVDFTLQPGKVSQQVTVQATSELLHTESAELGQTINEHSIVELPLNGRNPASLVLLTPGATDVLNTSAGRRQDFTTFPTETGASMDGGRQGSTYYFLDGAYNMDSYHLLAAPFPNPDATEEFTVIGNNFDARYGFTPGGVVSIVTKSGTNNWHGNAFEFLRNYGVNAKDYFAQQTDGLRRNQFGGSLGGPLVKDKLFIFGNYQATRQNQQVLNTQTFVPSDAMRAGDFSALCQSGFDSNGLCMDREPSDPTQVTGQIWHANLFPDHSVADAPGTFYPYNYIDPTTFNSAAVSITSLLPHTTDPLGHLQAVGYFEAQSYNEGTIRADYNINDRQRISARAFLNFFNQPASGTSLLNSNRSWAVDWQNYAGTWTWTINPSIVNNFTASYSRMYDISNSGLNADGKPVCFSQFINISDTTPGAPCSMYLDMGGGPGGGFSIGQNHNGMNRWTLGFSDSLSISKGKHLMVVGADVLRQYWYLNTNYGALPIIEFWGGVAGNFTGYGFSDFLLGDVGDFFQGGGESTALHQWMYAPYFSDQYKVKPNLTLSFGVRWEPFLAPLPEAGRIPVYAPGEQSTRYPNAPTGVLYPGDAGVPAAGMPNSYGYFDPRVGIAWQPKALPNTTIRAAFGMYATPVDYSQWNHTADTAPFSPSYFALAGYTTNSIIPFDNPWWSINPQISRVRFRHFPPRDMRLDQARLSTRPCLFRRAFPRDYIRPG